MTITRWLIAIILVAVALRVISALVQGNQVAALPGIYDQLSYDALARRLLEGHGFSFAEASWPATRAGEPTAHWSFLYTLYLTGLYAVVGVHPLAPRLAQAVAVGILLPWLSWRLGRRAFDDRVGLVAAGLSAIYPYFAYYGGALMTEPFYIVGILWTLDAGLRLARQAESGRRTGWRWVEVGLALGLTTLLRQLFLLFAPFLLVWAGVAAYDLFNRRRRVVAWLGGVAVVGLVVALLVLPWTVRNYRAFGTFVLLNTNAGYAFFWGNHPIYGTKFHGILPASWPTYQELIPSELLSLNEAALDQALLRRGIGFVLENPGRIALLSLSRSLEYFKFWPSPESGLLSNAVRVFSFGLLLPLILGGLWLTFARRWAGATREQRTSIGLLLLFAGVYSAIHLLTWALIRYRLPVDAVLMPFAAVGLIALAQRVRVSTARRAGHDGATGPSIP